MAVILKNSKVFLKGYEISGDLNSVSITDTADILDATVLGCSARKRKGGLHSHEIKIGGFWNATTGLAADNSSDAIDPLAWKAVGSTDSILSITQGSSVIGTTAVNKAWMSNNVSGEYAPTGTVGDMLSFGAGFMGDGRLVRGYMMQYSSVLSTGATINIKKIGFRGPNKGLHFVAHIMDHSSAGAKLKFHVEQDVTTDFTGTPSTEMVLSISSAHVGTAQWNTTALGSTLDHSYRIKITTTAALNDPSFRAALFLGIK